MHYALRIDAGYIVDKLREIEVCIVISPIRNGAYGDESHTVVMAHLCHGSTFHFFRLGLVPCCL